MKNSEWRSPGEVWRAYEAKTGELLPYGDEPVFTLTIPPIDEEGRALFLKHMDELTQPLNIAPPGFIFANRYA